MLNSENFEYFYRDEHGNYIKYEMPELNRCDLNGSDNNDSEYEEVDTNGLEDVDLNE